MVTFYLNPTVNDAILGLVSQIRLNLACMQLSSAPVIEHFYYQQASSLKPAWVKPEFWPTLCRDSDYPTTYNTIFQTLVRNIEQRKMAGGWELDRIELKAEKEGKMKTEQQNIFWSEWQLVLRLKWFRVPFYGG